MTAQRGHCGPCRRDSESNPAKSLAEECAITKERDVLLGAVITAYPLGQGPQPHPLTPGEDDAPKLTLGWWGCFDSDDRRSANDWRTAHPGPSRCP